MGNDIIDSSRFEIPEVEYGSPATQGVCERTKPAGHTDYGISNKGSASLDCYVINLDRAVDRWEKFRGSFEPLDLNLIRFSAVEGRTLELPHPDYSERRYRLYHGRRTNKNELGCFFSHVSILRRFLESGREHALVCEDDVSAKPDLVDILNEAIRYRKSWDLLRLNGLKVPYFWPYADLGNGYHLGTPITWFGGTGAYLVNRFGAERILRQALPMRVPYDHALDQNWLMGIRAAMIRPYPILLNECADTSLIVIRREDKLPFYQRYPTILPYRGVMSCGRLGKQISTAIGTLFCRPKPEEIS